MPKWAEKQVRAWRRRSAWEQRIDDVFLKAIAFWLAVGTIVLAILASRGG